MQFAVEMMRNAMPLVLMGQIKVGLIRKFLAVREPPNQYLFVSFVNYYIAAMR
jgi:hypothetical protein